MSNEIEESQPNPTADQTGIRWSPTSQKLFAALIQAQAEMGPVTKNFENTDYHSKYADLAQNINACRKPLNDHGIGVFQPITAIPGGVRVTNLLLHTSGEWLQTVVDFPAPEHDPQSYGKAIAYARRYSLSALLSIPAEDDDAQSATNAMRDPQAPAGTPRSAPGPRSAQRSRTDPGANTPKGPCAPTTSFFKEFAGQPWADMPRAKLDWYAEAIHQHIQDPKKAKYISTNEAVLAAIIGELDRRNALARAADAQQSETAALEGFPHEQEQ